MYTSNQITMTVSTVCLSTFSWIQSYSNSLPIPIPIFGKGKNIYSIHGISLSGYKSLYSTFMRYSEGTEM